MVKTLFKKILLPVDGSPQSQKALKFAAKIANSSESELIILNVIDSNIVGVTEDIADRFEITYTEPVPTDDVLERYSFFYSEKLDEIRGEKSYKLAEKIVNSAAKESKKHAKTVKTEIGLGPVAETIVRVAEKEKVDLIVIGSRGLSGFKRLLMGHVSSDVTEKAHCPVLVIR